MVDIINGGTMELGQIEKISAIHTLLILIVPAIFILISFLVLYKTVTTAYIEEKKTVLFFSILTLALSTFLMWLFFNATILRY